MQIGQHPVPESTIVHLSDTHLTADAVPLHGAVDADANLAAALRRLPTSGIDVDAIVVTGDIADTGDEGAYRRVRDLLEPVAADLGARLVWVMGNHDERAAFRAGLRDEERSTAPVDEVHDLDGLRLIVLDSTVPGHHHGEIGTDQLAWLREVLAVPAPRGTVIAMHHPPLPMPLGFLAMTELRDQDPFAEVLAGTDVRAVIAGHLHYASHSTFAGIPVTAAPATCYTADIVAEGGDMRGVDGGQGFDLVHVYADRILHSTIPVGAHPTIYQVSAEQLRYFMSLSPEQQRELAESR
ncbi:metallophosphoesterase [Microbacterium sp. Au-Mic1]|uniref:metallophosphoesterase n=1 Tax=Microbacterium sp. Au-Mic1 TaxID=2906457 RepID=UPI001E29F866|nr:metallophosphoesterase [Microbacterium sp. Au-Mic1]MCE4026567.1 metallophosphoesterase [Microbacterium sp. Au-Mic1]